MTACLEHCELAAAIDLKVGIRILHRVDVADLAGQVEDHRLTADQALHGQHVPHVDRAYRQSRMILNRLQVEQVRARFGDQAVDHQHMCAQIEQTHREIRADEAQPAGDQRALALVETSHTGARGGVAAPDTSRWGSNFNLSHKPLNSTSVRATLGKLKNWL